MLQHVASHHIFSSISMIPAGYGIKDGIQVLWQPSYSPVASPRGLSTPVIQPVSLRNNPPRAGWAGEKRLTPSSRFWLEPKYGKIGVFNIVAIDCCSGAATLLQH